MPKITIGITGLLEILDRDYGIEEPDWRPDLLQYNRSIKKLYMDGGNLFGQDQKKKT